MKKRFFQLVLTAVLSVSCIATGVNVSAAPLSSEGYSIEKVSHPERGAVRLTVSCHSMLWEKRATVTKAMYGPA